MVEVVARADEVVFAGGEVAMPDFLQTPSFQVLLFLTATAVLITVGAYLVARVRASFQQSPPPTNDLLTNFRELHSKGELSDEEYRTIKSMLAERLQEELTNKVKEG